MNSETSTPQGDAPRHGRSRADASNHEHTAVMEPVSFATARIVPCWAGRRSTVENMSGVLQPVGPEPPIVYWVRRGTILVIVLTLLIGGWWLLSSGSAASPGAGEPVAAVDEVTGEEIGEDGEPIAPIDEAVASPAEPTDCPDSAIEVTASTDSSTYRVGRHDPVLTLTIENIGEIACFRDIGPKANELKITSGGYHVWSSDDCSTSDESNVTLMAPGQQAVSSLTWNSRLSQKGCPDDGKGRKAKAGRYEVVGRNIDIESEGVPFALSNKNN